MHDTRGEEQYEGYRKYEWWWCVGPDNDEGKVDDMGAGGCRIMHELRISVVSVNTLEFLSFPRTIVQNRTVMWGIRTCIRA